MPAPPAPFTETFPAVKLTEETVAKGREQFDPEKPAVTSGIRLGSPAATSRGFGTAEFREVGLMINEVLEGLAASNDGSNTAAEQAVGARVQALCARFPIYK